MAIIYAPLPNSAMPGAIFSGVCTCPSSVAVGSVVYLTGNNAVDLANALSSSTAPAFGIVYSKPTSTTCIVQLSGVMTGFTGLSADATYFLSDTAGTFNMTPPSSPGEVIQRIGSALNTTTLLIAVDTTIVVL